MNTIQLGKILVKYDDIVYVETEKQTHYLRVHTVADEIVVRMTLANLYQETRGQFVWANRAYLVNPKYIQIEGDGFLELENGIVIDVSRRRRSNVRRKIMNHHNEESKIENSERK